jgi:hypothetical protein
MFAGEPPSSSDPTKRLRQKTSIVPEPFRRLLLQIGGANIALGADRAVEAAAFLTPRSQRRRGNLDLLWRLTARSFV